MKVISQTSILVLCFSVVLFPVFGQEQDDLTRALENAIRNNDIAGVTSLLKAGANPNGIYEKQFGTTFLMLTLNRYDNQMAELLLDHGVDPNIRRNDGKSAAYYGNTKGIALLISRGTRFDIVDREGETPLMYRIGKNLGSREATLILQWEETHTPGFTAGYNTRQDYLSALLPPFLKRNFQYDNDDIDLKLAERLLSQGANPAAVDSNGIHVFHNISSSYRHRREMRNLFLDYGAPLNSVDRDDKTPLMHAAGSSWRDSAEVEFLLDRGADPNFQNNEGETALMHTIAIATANLLLARGAELNVQDNNGKTALINTWQYPEVQRVLLDAGADPSIRDNEGRNVLFTIREGAINTGLLDDFLAGGCDINAYSTLGHTAILSAADRSDSAVVLALLERGADPLLLDDNGKTVLQIYLEARKSESRKERIALEMTMITALLEAGVQPAALDTQGDSALFYVMRKTDSGLKPIQDLLLEYSSDDDKEIASAIAAAEAAAEKNRDTRQAMSKKKTAIAWGIGLPLVVGGLSILAREGAFSGNLSANFMGPVNGVLTLGTASLFLGAFIGGRAYSGRGSSLDDVFGAMASGFLGGTLGLIGGIVIGCLPPVRRAFTQNPALYYIPTAAAGIIGGSIILLNIRR